MKNPQSKPLETRKARLTDVPALVTMWQEFSREHERIVLSGTPEFRDLYAKKEDAALLTEEYFRRSIRSRNHLVYIAESADKPAGYLIATIRPNPPIFEVGKVGHFGSLFVRKPFRGAGLSSRFRDIAIEWFKRKGLTHMSLNVASDNTHAHSIYRAWGFLDYQIEMRVSIGVNP